MLPGRAAREDIEARFGVWAAVPVGVPAGITRSVAEASTKYLRSMEFPSVVPLERSPEALLHGIGVGSRGEMPQRTYHPGGALKLFIYKCLESIVAAARSFRTMQNYEPRARITEIEPLSEA